MIISINDPVGSTYIFIVLLLAAILIWARRRQDNDFFPVSATQELKGLAMLVIVFSHIGLFLISGQNFLYPLSIMAGVGVNLFLFLSGYGLAASSIKNKLSISQFYGRRLIKLFLPFWLSLLAFFFLDYFVLGLSYGPAYLARSFLGYFPRADLFNDVNSPLWYFTLILFYYLVFPLAFLFKNHRLSALALYLAAYLIVWLNPAWLNQVMHLYEIHILAFPLGVLLASLQFEPNQFLKFLAAGAKNLFQGQAAWLKIFKPIGYWALSIAFLAVAVYTAYYSNIGGELKEELTSLATVFALVGLFLIKKINFGFFYIFGLYSYEIYLLHWPLLYRYDVFYRLLPAWLATALYLILFIALGWILKKISDNIMKLFSREKISN